MTWVATHTGRAFDLLAPRALDVDFDEIALALSRLPRFHGMTRQPYSVAEHSCRVAAAMPARFAIYGLLHDAHEAYIGDIVTPLKEALCEIVPTMRGSVHYALQEIPRRIDAAIYAAAGLAPPSAECLAAVKAADLALLATEKRDLMAPCDRPWLEGVKPLPEFIIPWRAGRAREEFLRQLAKWTGAKARADAA